MPSFGLHWEDDVLSELDRPHLLRVALSFLIVPPLFVAMLWVLDLLGIGDPIGLVDTVYLVVGPILLTAGGLALVEVLLGGPVFGLDRFEFTSVLFLASFMAVFSFRTGEGVENGVDVTPLITFVFAIVAGVIAIRLYNRRSSTRLSERSLLPDD